MTITSSELLDTSIAQLRTLAAFLREQLGQGTDSVTAMTPQVRACREALASLSDLILRLQAARETFAGAADLGHAAAGRHDSLRASGTG
jgi:hypothetical protein